MRHLMILLSVLSIGADTILSDIHVRNGLTTLDGKAIDPLNRDSYGYDYSCRSFDGYYGDHLRPVEQTVPNILTFIKLRMKWGRYYLATTSRDGDSYPDYHQGYETWRGSRGWVYQEMSGFRKVAERIVPWDYQVKIVAAPKEAVIKDGSWYLGDKKLGTVIWEDFYIEYESYQGPDREEYEIPEPAKPTIGVQKEGVETQVSTLFIYIVRK